MKRTIGVVTGTRADYGLLRWLMHELQAKDDVTLAVIATGTHFDPSFGETWRAIVDDGFEIAERVDILTSDDTPLGVALSTGEAVRGLSTAFSRVAPDIVVVLGDRYEILAAAESAFLMRIPVAHLHGGELTEGALDDGLRHAVTKLSSLHFVSTQEYAHRVIQLGESPNRVHVVGAAGLDNFERLPLLAVQETRDLLGLSSNRPFVLCTQHPETTLDLSAREFAAPLLTALDEITDVDIVITKANADAGGRALNEVYEQFALSHPDRVRLVASLGQIGYLSAMRHAEAVVGNSSSGIIEAPTAGVPTVNIGNRQRGRIRAPSVIDVENEAASIVAAIRMARQSEFREMARQRNSPYGKPGVAERVAAVLTTVDVQSLSTKEFFDIPVPETTSRSKDS